MDRAHAGHRRSPAYAFPAAGRRRHHLCFGNRHPVWHAIEAPQYRGRPENTVTGLSLQTDPAAPPQPRPRRARACWRPVRCRRRCAVAGADIAAADQRALQATQALGGGGNLTLNDPAYNADLAGTFFSVLRTGTGSLDLLAGGSFSEATPYGVYTAGTQSAPLRTADGRNPYDLAASVSGGASRRGTPSTAATCC